MAASHMTRRLVSPPPTLRSRVGTGTTLLALLLLFVLVMATSVADGKLRTKSRRSSLDRMLGRRAIDIKFSCAGRPVGYYADVDFDCKVFHICDNFGRRIPMRCPTQTRFNQMYRVCDWADNVDCPDSPAWYHVNGDHH